ncbi:MAG: hypothetical protein JOS17DRAFT_787590 [Linnemannia elongata]|nr:MAG: hypothetical protein JOS17DRAFT_787590 [Linnemannia elongata]
MSIFHIPELFDLIRPEIAKQDLVHCCRVNKSWNAAFTPTLWQYFPPDPPTKRYDRHQWRTRIYACLRSLIEEDLLYEQEQEQEHTQSGDTLDRFNNSNNDDANVLLPALTRNGHWFRTLIIDQQMLKAPFRQQSYQITSVPPPDPIAATASTASVHRHRHHTHNPRLDTPGILLHLLMRCSNLQSLQLAGQDIDAAAYHFWKRIATVGFPGSSKDLNIKISSCVPMRLFIQPRERSDYLHHLDSVLKNGLPNLDTLHLCTHYYRLEDIVVAGVLAMGRKGWKSLVIPFLDESAAMEAMKHCSTLEELELRRAVKLPSRLIRQILSNCPNLVRFEALAKDWYTEDLIDLDPITNALTAWSCESTLKVFQVRISGIPRPRVIRVALEQYPGQGKDIQHQVYGRLARCTNLERLELGHPGVRFDEDYRFYPPHGEEVRNIREDRVDCLEMTLEGGLDMLEGLIELRELSVSRMASSVGVEEVQWMIRHWPKLKAIRGLTSKDWVGSDDEDLLSVISRLAADGHRR